MTFNSFLFLLFLVLLSYGTTCSLSNRPVFGSKVADDELNKICAEAQNPTYCYDTLKADPRTATANVRELNFIAADLVITNGMDTYSMIRRLVDQESDDPTLQTRYELCYDVYGAMVIILAKARDESDPTHPIVIEDFVSSVLWNANKCHDQFLTPPYGDTSLKDRHDKLVQYCDILTVVAAYSSIEM